jgi:hypothetical protein
VLTKRRAMSHTTRLRSFPSRLTLSFPFRRCLVSLASLAGRRTPHCAYSHDRVKGSILGIRDTRNRLKWGPDRAARFARLGDAQRSDAAHLGIDTGQGQPGKVHCCGVHLFGRDGTAQRGLQGRIELHLVRLDLVH